MPVIKSAERYTGVPFLLIDGLSPMIGWQFRSEAKGGPAFVIVRRSGFGTLKALESFPLNANGWASAWGSLVTNNPAAAPKVLARLEAREAEVARAVAPDVGKVAELDARSLTCLRDVAYLGGYAPTPGIVAGQRYDARFFPDQLLVTAPRQAQVITEVPYRDIEDVEIGGPGLVKTGGGFVGGGFGAKGAIEGMAIAAVLNGLTTRTSIKTVLRIQGSGCELFLLHTNATPEQLRIELSRPLAAIRSARALDARAASDQTPAKSATPVEELAKLAEMMEKGLLTREEFELMKAKILDLPT